MYKSIEGQQEIASWYDKELSSLAVHSRIVNTPSGDTHVLEAGSASLPALMLLPGTNFSALSWEKYIVQLSTDFHVIAVDIIGQPGKSAPARPSFKGTAYAEWLVTLLNGLSIDRAHVMGHSLGGGLALKLAAFAPERVGKVVLIDPAGIIRLRITPRIIWKSMPLLLRPGERSSRGLLELMSVQEVDPKAVEWMALVSKHVKSSLAPPPISNEELQAVKADVLLLSGEQDVFLPPDKLVQKARQLFPNIEVHIIPDAGHLLPDEQPEQVLRHVRKFLKRTDGGEARP